mmetsp:Transcript_80335/g.213219  ORF Transcript_80335/g.213219 Transcript_80335/m.213219 type:complete len:81 (-) Transcript_80335:55-297(-)
MSNIMIEGLRSASALGERKVSAGTTQLSMDDDALSENSSLTTGLPSECDGTGKDTWYREISINEDASTQDEPGLCASAGA